MMIMITIPALRLSGRPIFIPCHTQQIHISTGYVFVRVLGP